ncbi:SMI1/KNR4 family protein, partial [bacterium]|nr:SMI1/KNR4 family protein [bacterium]
IPIGDAGNGDLICIDLSPGNKGKYGQIILFIHDNVPRYHLGNSITDYLGELDIGLLSGKYFLEQDYGFVVSEES